MNKGLDHVGLPYLESYLACWHAPAPPTPTTMAEEEEKERRKEEAGMKRALKRGSDDGSYKKMLKAIRSGHSVGQMLSASWSSCTYFDLLFQWKYTATHPFSSDGRIRPLRDGSPYGRHVLCRSVSPSCSLLKPVPHTSQLRHLPTSHFRSFFLSSVLLRSTGRRGRTRRPFGAMSTTREGRKNPSLTRTTKRMTNTMT